MRRVSLIFALIALFCLTFADTQIYSSDPFSELGKISKGLLTPDFNAVWSNIDSIYNTVLFAVCGIALGIVLGFCLSFFYQYKFIRLPLSFLRSIHEIFWVMLLMTPLGLNHITAVLGIAIPFMAIIAKVYAEIIEESDKKPLNALPHGSGLFSGFLFATLPRIWGDLKTYTSYRFECALRSSAVIGFVGFPTIGYHMESYFNVGAYSETAALFYTFLLIVASRKLWLNKRLIPIFVPLAFYFISWEMRFSWDNTARFFNEIIPYPIRSSLNNGTEIIWGEFYSWLSKLLTTQAGPGIWNTFLLTQLALVGTAIITLSLFPFSSRHFVKPPLRSCGRFFSIFFRTVPEYILVYVLILPLGPSLLPAIITIALHNSAIIMHLVAANADRIVLPVGAATKKADRYLFEILPKVYGQFLAFLFYRWEIIMRESAVLGVLGITTIGFYIDSAISESRLDRAVILIAITAVLNMAIDTLSMKIRRRIKN